MSKIVIKDPEITKALKQLKSIRDFLNSDKANSSKSISAKMDEARDVLDELSSHRSNADQEAKRNIQPALDISSMFNDLLLQDPDSKVCTVGYLYNVTVKDGKLSDEQDVITMYHLYDLMDNSVPKSAYIQYTSDYFKPVELLDPEVGAEYIDQFISGINRYIHGDSIIEG